MTSSGTLLCICRVDNSSKLADFYKADLQSAYILVARTILLCMKLLTNPPQEAVAHLGPTTTATVNISE